MKEYNPNPEKRSVIDCPVRALCAAFGMEWRTAYTALCLEGCISFDMPNSNAVWGKYLREHGFAKRALPDSCMDGYTVADFMEDHPDGVYVLALPDHVVCVREGELMDSWDSSHQIVLYYFEKVE